MTRALDRPQQEQRESLPQWTESSDTEHVIVDAGVPVVPARDSRARQWAIRHHLMSSGEPADHHAQNAKTAHRYEFLEDSVMARAMYRL